MKKSKILVPVMALLALTTAASVTGTVAWFSANTTVSATGMNVKVKSESKNLLIAKDTIVAGGPGSQEISLATDEVTALLPVAHETFTSLNTSNTISWYTMDASSASTATGDAETKKAITTNLEKYVLQYTLCFTEEKGSVDATNLQVSSTWGESDDSAVRCLVVGSAGFAELSAASTSSTSILANSVTAAAVETVKVYVYYDGNQSNIFTNGFADIATATINLKFTIQ